MREWRLYAMDGDEPAGRWRIVDRTTLHVTHGVLWVTIEGRLDDHWLRAGDALRFAPGMRVWIGAERGGATFAFGPHRAPVARVAPAVRHAPDARHHAAASLPT